MSVVRWCSFLRSELSVVIWECSWSKLNVFSALASITSSSLSFDVARILVSWSIATLLLLFDVMSSLDWSFTGSWSPISWFIWSLDCSFGCTGVGVVGVVGVLSVELFGACFECDI